MFRWPERHDAGVPVARGWRAGRPGSRCFPWGRLLFPGLQSAELAKLRSHGSRWAMSKVPYSDICIMSPEICMGGCRSRQPVIHRKARTAAKAPRRSDQNHTHLHPFRRGALILPLGA